MRINFDRLSQLAGLPASGNRRGLYEGKDHGDQDEGMRDEGMRDMDEDDSDVFEEREDEGMFAIEEDSLNESRRRNMFEAQLKQVIDEEVQNVMDEMNLTGQWVYGDRRPTRSRKGYTNQGSMMPGIGFRRR